MDSYCLYSLAWLFQTIYGSDCTNGTWLHDMGVTNYSTLMGEYATQRENRERWAGQGSGVGLGD